MHGGLVLALLGNQDGALVGSVAAHLYFNSVERRLAAIILIVWFVLFLTWPGSRD